jgi:hypothetical protein
MNRYGSTLWNESIQTGLQLIPRAIRELAGPFDIFVSYDPVFAGLSLGGPNQYDGRSNSTTPHVLYPVHMQHINKHYRVPTIVLPERCPDYAFEPWAIIHEFGHILDYRLRFSFAAIPWWSYMERNRNEAFAEAFTQWALPPYRIGDLRSRDISAYEFFQSLL